MKEINLSGITKTQRGAMIWAYQVNGSFTMAEFKECWNVRTLFALQNKRIVLLNVSTGYYYFNPDHAVEIRVQLEAWFVPLRDYAEDFGAWFDSHLETASKPDPMDEPPIDPEDTPILPMRPVSHYTHCPVCGTGEFQHSCLNCGYAEGETVVDFLRREDVDEEEESRLEDGFLFNQDVRTAYFEDDYDGAFGGGGDPGGWMRHFRPDPAKVRADYKAGCLFVRKMTGSGWTKDDVIRFIHKFLFPSAAFIAGTESFFFKNYRHNVRYCNWYHWQSDDLREKWENHPRNYIPF